MGNGRTAVIELHRLTELGDGDKHIKEVEARVEDPCDTVPHLHRELPGPPVGDIRSVVECTVRICRSGGGE